MFIGLGGVGLYEYLSAPPTSLDLRGFQGSRVHETLWNPRQRVLKNSQRVPGSHGTLWNPLEPLPEGPKKQPEGSRVTWNPLEPSPEGPENSQRVPEPAISYDLITIHYISLNTFLFYLLCLRLCFK